MEAVGKYDFDASSPNVLSFRKGDVLKILSSKDASWYTAEMQGQEGFVPQNYLDVQIPRWFQEDASRSSSEEDLMTKTVGHFLIRGCQSSPGDFSISVRHEHDVQHFKIIKDNQGQYFLWAEKFTSFNRLVDYYKSTSISKQRHIFLKDGSEDGWGPTAHQNAGVAAVASAPEPTDQFEAAGRRSPLPVGAGPAAAPQRVVATQMRSSFQVKAVPLQVRADPTQGRGGAPVVLGRGGAPVVLGRGGAPVLGRGGAAPVLGRGALLLGRGAPLQVKATPAQVRGGGGPGPPTQVRRGPPTRVRALYSFQVEEEDELGFAAGDVIEVLDCSDPSWWRGRLGGRCGLFPANYTEEL